MSDNRKPKSVHWADIAADAILRRNPDKKIYVCASGITPSGTVHIGNFREIISVELVVRALRDKGRQVRFIYSWDDYDVFRKVPANMPEPETLKTYLRKPIVSVPDTAGRADSYARGNEVELEEILPEVGVEPEYIRQSEMYRASRYAEGIRTALEKADTIRELLDEHRTEPLPADWMPVSVFCGGCELDTTTPESWDGEWSLTYSCSSCGNRETVDLRETSIVKLPWRVDWPMRWKYEGVDFEPAGKEHHSSGGSFDTAKQIVTRVYAGTPPHTFKYDFIRLKGGGGKLSSSSGEVVGLREVLQVYQPEVVRYLFAGTRPNTEFAVSFDLDVLKVYEDYDKCERTYFEPAETEKARKRREKIARTYELSQVHEVPAEMPYQIQIRHLCNLLQIHSGDIDAVIEYLGDVQDHQMERFGQRAGCAWFWVTTYAPDDFRFALRKPDDPPVELPDPQTRAVRLLCEAVSEHMDVMGEKDFSGKVYEIAEQCGLESKELFPAVYKALIGKEKGPRLVSFLYAIGRERVAEILSGY